MMLRGGDRLKVIPREVLIKEKIVYVIACVDGDVNRFLSKDLLRKDCFVEDASNGLKFKNRNTAQIYIDLYRRDTRDLTAELVVIPMKVSYSLINELEDEWNECRKEV